MHPVPENNKHDLKSCPQMNKKKKKEKKVEKESSTCVSEIAQKPFLSPAVTVVRFVCVCLRRVRGRENKREPALSETEISPVSLWLFQLILTTAQDENLVAM